MPLSRLENFLKNAEGNILYVNPSDFDATDSFENQGNSLTRPFKTIQRALIEAARFSYQSGENNDRIDRTTILVYPGTHYIDNRPGYSIEEIDGAAVYKRRVSPNRWEETTLTEFNELTNFDILSSSNDLYKYNSVSGGAILPRGTSIIGLDLRKTKIRPLYVPDPNDDEIESTSILNVTGTCYFTAFSIFDADPTKTVYKDYSGTQVVPNYSHHKVTCFEYGDGVNMVALADYQTYLTDLDMYYYKVAKAYGDITGRGLGDFPVTEDFEPSVDEFRIVGSLDANPLGISSIKAGNGNGTGDLNEITVTTSNKLTGDTAPHNLYVDSPFLISGVTVDGEAYNGSFTVSDVVGINTFKYTANQTPLDFLPDVSFFDTATVTVGSDTVSSASPYIFNCSLRSVFGMNGMHADGSKATGFKSMVTAQFTGVSLQKDNNAFILYDNGTFYEENTLPTNSLEKPLHTNSKAIFKPDWENFHIKCSNNAFIQCVSIFAIGFAKHFVAETGGDQSITNSNSNFGNTSLEAVSFKPESFDRDDVGYITHVIPPRDLLGEDNEVNWLSLDVEKTINSADDKLYIFDQTDEDNIPPYQIDGYRLGARDGDTLSLTITVGTAQTTYTAPVLMPVPFGDKVSARKEYEVDRNNGQNLISNNIVNLTETHQFFNGERIRVFSDTGQTPDGLENEGIYYAITGGGLSPNQIKIAQSLNDAISDIPVLGINNNGGIIKIVSRVSDKIPGQLGHPIQWDPVENNWYLTSDIDGGINQIRTAITTTGLATLGEETSAAFFRRKSDNRSIDDKLFKLRYVIPKEYDNAKPPEAGYVLQESKTVGVTSVSYTNDVLTNTRDLRNEKVIVNATAAPVISGSQVITLTTELPHGFIEGDEVKVQKIRSTNNPLSVGIVSTYNGIYTITNIINSKQFQYVTDGVKVEPGTFTNDINLRNTRQQREALPVVSRDEYKESYFIYRVNQIKKHVPGDDGQDGIYHLICLNSSVSPTSNAGYQLYTKQFSQDVRNLYPQQDRDNLNTNPKSAVSYSDLKVIGDVITDDKRHSITREGLDYFIKGTKVGYAITQLDLSGTNNSTITVFTDVEHNLNSIKTFTNTTGSGYTPSSTLFSVELAAISSNGEGATAKVTTDATGAIANIELLDPGSAYAVGDDLSVPGGVVNATITITGINDNTTDAIELNGYYVDDLNDAFEISSIPSAKSIVLNAPLGISTNDPNSSGELGYVIPSGNVVSISAFEMSDTDTGIATFTTSNSHGLFGGNNVNIVSTGITAFDGSHLVKSVVGLTTFTVEILGAGSTAIGSTGKVLRRTFSAHGKTLGRGEENIASRATTLYDKKTNYVNAAFDNTATTINFSDPDSVIRGEYYQINSEIVRISGSSNPFSVLRGKFGTVKTTAEANTVARKVFPIPSELRRPSFMRASGHTFEYLGFGPGNYSTGMPQKQNRILSEQEVLKSQSKEQRGGSVVYTGMNDLGEFFSGSKKLSSATGEESVVDAPIITFTGDDAEGENTNLSSGIFDELLVRRRITVEGGENTNQTSQFYGPVNFTNKVTNTSDLGIETKNLFLKGTVQQAKLLTVGISTPTTNAKTPGDIQFLSNPTDGYIGHVYVESEWRPWGFISERPDEKTLMLDHLGIGNVPVPQNLIRLHVSDQVIFENLQITGSLTLDQPQSLGDVTFDDILVRGKATFSNTVVDEFGNLRDRTILCESGTQEFYNVETTGFSTYHGRVDFLANVYGIGGKFGNINIGIFNDNAITKVSGTGALVLDSDPNDRNGIVRVEDNFQVLANTDANVYQTWAVRDGLGIGTAVSAALEIKTINVSEDIVSLDLGIGNTSGYAKLALHTDDTAYPDGTFIINDLANGDTTITKRGASSTLKVESLDSGADMIFTVGTDQNFHITSLGQYFFEQKNAGTELDGHHLKLDQKGDGDVVLSWHRTKNNANIRWYAGIDKSDGNSWKLANPATTTAAGQEDFDRASETKLKIDTSGNTNILGTLDVGGNTISTPTTTTFNLVNTNISTLNFAKTASSITMGNNSASSFVSIRGTTQASSCTTGALRVAGGVGIAKNLYVCGEIGPATFSGTVTIKGVLTLEDNLTIAGTTTFGKTTNNTLCNVNTGAVQFDGGVGIAKNVSIGQGLCVQSHAKIVGVTTAAAFIKQGGGSMNGQSNFLRADGSDTIIEQQDFVNSLTYVPQPPITMNGYPKGNSIRLNSIASQFNGSKKTFNLFAPDGAAFEPEGAANLLVYMNGDTLLEPGADYIIPFTGTSPNFNYKPQIQFIVAPLAGVSCHIIALGGQGMVLDDEGWTAKGQLAVGKEQNRAEMLNVGQNDQVLVARSSETLGVDWMWLQQQPPIGSVHYFASNSAPEGYLICNGNIVPNGTGTVQGITADFSYLYSILGNTFGAAGKLPNLLERVAMGAGQNTNTTTAQYVVGDTGGKNEHKLITNDIPSHNHSITQDGEHKHGAKSDLRGFHKHINDSDGVHQHPFSLGTHSGHIHTVNITPESNHSHGQSTGVDGDHKHNANTDQRGRHSHPGSNALAGGEHNHGHNFDVTPYGNHSHPGSVANEGGKHSHPGGTTELGGAHRHKATTDGRTGSHSHPTVQVGQHSHNYSYNYGQIQNRKGDDRAGISKSSTTGQDAPNVSVRSSGSEHQHNLTTDKQDDHRHRFNTNTSPAHKHNVNVSGGGAHEHPIKGSVSPKSNHTHPLSINANNEHRHNVNIEPKSGHRHTINADGRHNHQAPMQNGGNHTHNWTLGDSTKHTHNINEDGKHDHTINTSPVGDHNHQLGYYGGTSNNQTKIDLRNPYLGLLPVIKAYYVGPKTTKNW